MTHTFEYAFNENYMLVLSHDEVVYGKGSLINKFIGNKMDKMGSMKTCFTMMIGHPGKKLLFMGQDFAQESEWNFKTGLDWWLCDDEGHRDVMNCWRTLLHIYKERPVLHNDCGGAVTCEWINSGDYNRNIFTFIRRNPWNYNNALIFVCNFAPVYRKDMGVGAPAEGVYKRIFTTYSEYDLLEVQSKEELCDGRKYKLTFDLRPYESVIFEVPFKEETEEEKKAAQKVKADIKKAHKEVKNDTAHIPQVEVPAELAEKKSAVKTVAKKKSAAAKKPAAKKTSAKKS